MTIVLVTGFEPFGGDATNSSGDAVALLAEQWTGAATLVTEILPVEFDGAAEQLDALVATHSPDLVIAVGLAGGRTAITPERVAINIKDARIMDNAGHAPVDEPVVAEGPAAYFSRLPVKAIVQGMRQAGIPAELSQTAGTYVCNAVMYRALHGAAPRAGFIHVPAATEIDVPTIARALAIAIETSLAVTTDVRASEGAES